MDNLKFSIELSIIIPCYNVEDYIEQCLNSILQQDILPKEILCIDDGSTDNTANIIKRYCETHTHIKYIYQENQGVSQARNTGLKNAISQYIQFVDPDDILHSKLLFYFFEIYNLNKNIELFYFENLSFQDFQMIEHKTKISNKVKKFLSGNDLFTHLINIKKYPGACWKYIFRKDRLDIKFEGRNHEDHLITLHVILSSKLCYYFEKPLYFYRKRSNSLTNKKKISKEYICLLSNVINKCTQYVQHINFLQNNTKIEYINHLRSDFIFNIDIYYRYREKPTIIKVYIHFFNRFFIKHKLKTLSNILYIIRYSRKNNVPLEHFIFFIKVAFNKNIDSMSHKIISLLN